MHSISPRICRITRLESPQIMTRPRSILVRSSKHKSSPLYSASFTVRSVTNLDSATRIVHSGSFHSIALNAPPLFLILADPSKLATIRGSPSSTVGGGMVILCRQSFRGAIAINISSISSRGVMLAANVPKISSSPFSHFLTSIVQLDSRAAQRPNLPLSPRDRISHANVEYRVSTVNSLETNIV